MRRFKVGIIILIIIGTLLTGFLVSCNGESVENPDMLVNKFDMDVEIDEKGDMHVKEVYFIENTVLTYNNYFYKQIAYNKNNQFGNSTSNKAQLVEDVHFVATENNRVVYDNYVDEYIDNYPDHFAGISYNNERDELGNRILCENNRSECDMLFYYNRPGFARFITFTFEYTIEGAITQYNDISELNWVMLDYQPFKFENITINITLPEGDYDIADEHTFFHGTNMAERTFVDNNKIVITADDMVSSEQIEVRLLLDNDVFDSVRSTNKVNYVALQEILDFEKEQSDKADLKYLLGYVGAFVIFGAYIIGMILFTLRAYKKYDKEHKSEFYNEYYRELPGNYPPAVMGYLYNFGEISDDDLTATLLDLIRRKYLILDTHGSTGVNEKKPVFTIKVNSEKSQSDLKEYESYLIRWFINDIGDGEKVTNQELNSYCDKFSNAEKYQRSCTTWNKLVKIEAKKQNFFDEDVKKQKAQCQTLGILISVLVGVGLVALSVFTDYAIGTKFLAGIICYCVAFSLYVSGIDRRSISGNEDYVRWKAFKKFLEDFSTFEDYPLPSIIIWEHYLVYATSFGIADKVMDQLKLKFQTQEFTYNQDDCTFVVYFGFGHRVSRLHHSTGGMRSQASSTIARHTAQRSGGGFSSGGGGFSGGSSFGGGGGSIGGGRR